jgi:flagellar secretion chaperone FliS
MNAAHSFRSYRSIATQTAPPGQLVVMLYDGAIRFLECALVGFKHDDPKEFNETINNNVLRAQEIISELDGSLDLVRGGELAATLRRLYSFMDNQLTHSNASKSPEGIRDALHRLSTLRDAWREMLVQRGSAYLEPAPYAPLAVTS